MRLTNKGVVALLASIVWALAVSSAAQAVIQVQRGISGVTLNMSPQQVKTALGAPTKVGHGHNDFGPFTQYRYSGGITVSFQGNSNVTAIAITGRTDRTARGVGVGSSEKAVKEGVMGVRCATGGGLRDCHVGTFKPGHRVTDFLLRHDRVIRVTVGLVID